MKTCKDCKYFMGMGDWNLCCSNPPARAKESWCGFLCYEDTEACENFKEKGQAEKFVEQVQAGKLPPIEEIKDFGIQYVERG
jgi:RNA polymerase subunit RPABC4/transcription elongation factor Spt4